MGMGAAGRGREVAAEEAVEAQARAAVETQARAPAVVLEEEREASPAEPGAPPLLELRAVVVLLKTEGGG